MRSPYIFVGGKLEAEGPGAKFAVSGTESPGTMSAPTWTRYFHRTGPARYAYYLRCQLSGPARLRAVKIVNDIQMAPSPARHGRWRKRIHLQRRVARRASGPDSPTSGLSGPRPGPPHAPALRYSRLRKRGRRDRFRLPVDELRRSRRRRDRGLPVRGLQLCRYEVAALHELRQAHIPDRRCRPARYTCQARPAQSRPKYDRRVRTGPERAVGTLERDLELQPRGPRRPWKWLCNSIARNRGVLRWTPNPMGRKPVAYRIYASDEKLLRQ